MKNPTNLLVSVLFGLSLLVLGRIAPLVPDRTIISGLLGMVICVFFPLLSLLCALIFAQISLKALAEDDWEVRQLVLEEHQQIAFSSTRLKSAKDVMADIYAEERAHLENLMLPDGLHQHNPDTPPTPKTLLRSKRQKRNNS